jgi:nucleoside-diphosphate-sugar epimerase
MAHYLITGVAGFIASRVAQLLLAQGHKITGIDNLNDAYDVRIKDYRLDQLRSVPGFDFHKLDISDHSELQGAVEQSLLQTGSIDAIINLAARAGVRQSVENPWVYLSTNVTGTLNLLEIAQQHHIKKFILASTSSVYGNNAPLPTPESATSDFPLQPYSASKKGAEALAYSYHYLYGIDVSVVRYFTVYGPAGRPDMVMFRFCQWISEGRTVQINGNGEQSRGFTYVDDIARGTIQALQPLGYEIINLGGHETVTINQLLHMFEDQLGKKALVEYGPMHPADMQTNWADVNKARRVLGWEPEFSLQQGITNLVSWYMAEREWASQIVTKGV